LKQSACAAWSLCRDTQCPGHHRNSEPKLRESRVIGPATLGMPARTFWGLWSLWLVARCRQTCPVDSYDLLEHPITSIRYGITPAVGITLLVCTLRLFWSMISKFRLCILRPQNQSTLSSGHQWISLVSLLFGARWLNGDWWYGQRGPGP